MTPLDHDFLEKFCPRESRKNDIRPFSQRWADAKDGEVFLTDLPRAVTLRNKTLLWLPPTHQPHGD